MKEILHRLLKALDRSEPVAYCRLVETRGSTPQKAGATMLVFGDGSQAGTLGGGCVEAEVKRQALQRLSDGGSEIARFQLDSDYGWDDGLICGGRMLILVEPLTDGQNVDYFRRLCELAEHGVGCTEVIAFDADKTHVDVPSSYLFDANDQLVTSLRGQELPATAIDNFKPLATRPRPYAIDGFAYLPVLPRSRLLIVGGGHVGQAVGELAAELDFDVWVVDDREEFVTDQRFPNAQKRISGSMDDVLPNIEVTPDTYCLIVTRGHNHDEKALYYLADRSARYVGMIGSRRKIKMIFDDLIAEGIDQNVLQTVFAPVGIDIGSQTVPEIAVSIAAELIAHRNLGRVPDRPNRVLTPTTACVQ